MSVAYAVMATVSVILLLGYCILVRQKEFWLRFLFVCVVVVNTGYLLLSLSKTLSFALFANKVAYFGSVFLCLCMLMSILKLCDLHYPRALPAVLLLVSVLMFAVICTTGLLPWYYKDVSLVFIQGGTILQKTYGALHPLYLVYLLLYFSAMILCIFYSMRKKMVASQKQAALMAAVVFGNISIWFVEKFIPLEFEFLSISYLFSEVILLSVHWMMLDYVPISELPQGTLPAGQTADTEGKMAEVLSRLAEGESLSDRETEILQLILQNKKRKDIADELHLSENTVKTHTRTLYAKLNVASRQELYSSLK